MIRKKHPHHNLEKKRSSFFAIGLACSLFFVLTAMEWTTTTSVTKKPPPEITVTDIDDIDIVITIPVKKPVPIPKYKPRPQPIAEPVPDAIQVPDPEPPIIDTNLFVLNSDPEPEIFDEPSAPFIIVQKMPQFGNGLEDLMNYLARNIKYPRMAKDAGAEGMVYVQFVVNKRGEIENPIVVKGIGYGCDKEALRVVKGMPKWKPGKQRGKRVPVQFTLPVNFKLL